MKARSVALLALLALGLMTGCGAQPVGTVATADATVEANRAYSIIDMQGIGPAYATKLKAAGLSNTSKFLAATQDRKGRQDVAEQTGISYKLVLRWAQKAELMRINGIGVKQADLLEACGVDSVKDLARRDAGNLTERIWAANHVGTPFVKTNPSEATVAKWIQAAKELAQSAIAE
ncbi:MAG TPA: DUF4332 domain-containing protein [Stenomitos sp.]